MMPMKSLAVRFVLYFFCAAIFIDCSFAEPRLPHIFSDHMILQREQPIAVWGWAEPSEKIKVTLGSASQETMAAADGTWKIALAKMPAGGPFTLTVKGQTTIVLKDVLVGEVWVASGQSNMTYALGNATGAAEEVAKADYPQIRLFTVPQNVALSPQTDTLPASWNVCSPDSAKGFSAVAYFFARDLYKSLHVPVGIVLSAWSGSRGEEWVSQHSLAQNAELQPILQRWQDSPPEVKVFGETGSRVSLEFDDFDLLPKGEKAPTEKLANFDDGTVETSTGGSWSYNWTKARDLEFELASPGRRGKGYSARIHGHADGASDSRLQAIFHSGGGAADMSAYRGVRFWMRGQGSFQFQALQPTIYDWDYYTTENIQATPEWTEVTVLFKDLKQSGWGVQNEFTPQALTGIQIISMPTVGEPDRPPSGLYGGMIAPLLNYRIRGAIWYQGEGNTGRSIQYRRLLPALIENWRSGWRENDFPFGIVQLPNHGSSPEFGDSIWAEMREAQLLTAKKVANTGLAVTIDVGDPRNLHPPNKEPVGARLALWALATTYGRTGVYSGPRYEKSRVEGGAVRVRFQFVGSGLEARGGELQGFSVAGADKVFRKARARIAGDEVIVESAEVPVPVAVRYAWTSSPSCNLYNKEGLPASPFRTDDWPVASSGKE
ncbi:MAG TPA: sialate O-acetylesterase [Candidatus Saccharimonadales bacterium]|nr:sialate O-acetylesterase [Candidatus Saccharimonadales bacterium]